MNDVLQAACKPYWIELMHSQVRIIEGKYRTRILEAGDPSAPALLLLHGTGGHLENYALNIAHLSQHFHVIALDFLWHGRSQTEGYDANIIPVLVEQLLDVMAVLGIETAHIEGQSMGGWVAMQFAIHHPECVNKLILTTTMGYRPDAGAIADYVEPNWAANLASSIEVLQNPSFDNIRTRMSRILAHPECLSDEAIWVRQALYQQAALSQVQQLFITEYLSGSTIAQHIVTDALARQIQAPTLVYWGDANRTPPSLGQHIATQIPNGRFFCAPDTGHWAQFESAPLHNQIVTDFLLETTPSQESHAMSNMLVGRWQLQAWEQLYDDGRRQLPMGEAPEGFIQYTADGYMNCMICRAERPAFTTGGQWNASDAEKASAYNSMLSYAGRYSVAGDTITHYVDISLFPNWVGSEQKRVWHYDADRQTITLSARLEDNTSEARTAQLVWQMANVTQSSF